MGLTSANREQELHLFSVYAACIKFTAGNKGVTLIPNSAFMPKVLASSLALDLVSFSLLPFFSVKQEHLHGLCPVQILCTYMNRTQMLRKSDQLIVSLGKESPAEGVTF